MDYDVATYTKKLDEEIEQSLSGLDAVYLNDLAKNSQMNRFDKKFIFHASFIPELITKASNRYSILSINGKQISKYKSYYYDTPDYKMYHNHHNGKTNRFKIRIREYQDSGDKFVEVKHKNSQLFTTKKRIPYFDGFPFSNEATSFIKQNTWINPEQLNLSLITSYNRITLINKQKDERITIDFNLFVKHEKKEIQFKQLGIAEIKNSDRHLRTHFNDLLKERRIKQDSFSKYCIGLALTNKKVKHNEFKEKLRRIEKITNRHLILTR